MSSPTDNRTRGTQGRYVDKAVASSAETSSGVRGRRVLVEVAEVALLAAILYVVINFAIQTVHVVGSSMFPTVVDGDYLIATKVDYRLHPPQRGDIVIMRDPYDPSKDFIKRVIAVPGDHLLIRGGHVYIDGRLLDEPYLNSEPWTENADWPLSPTASQEGVLMGPDDYFVMGDNRNHSSDSRVFGVVHRDEIRSRAWIRVLPLTSLGLVDGSRPVLTSRHLPGLQEAA